MYIDTFGRYFKMSQQMGILNIPVFAFPSIFFSNPGVLDVGARFASLAGLASANLGISRIKFHP